MNYTNNYHLPQWEKPDRVLMEDFNQMCLDLESGLTNNASQAKSDASAALRAANAAQATANKAYCPGNLPYKTGTYTGNGGTTTIELGFTPSFLIISGQGLSTSNTNMIYVALTGLDRSMSSVISFNGTEMILYEKNHSYAPYVNKNGISYSYIAFR